MSYTGEAGIAGTLIFWILVLIKSTGSVKSRIDTPLKSQCVQLRNTRGSAKVARTLLSSLTQVKWA